MKILEAIMQIHLVMKNKSNYYLNILINVSSRECLALANSINNKDALATWIMYSKNILFTVNKNYHIQLHATSQPFLL